VYLRQPITPADVGLTSRQVSQGGIGVSTHGLPGLWIAFIACAVFALIAVGQAFRIGAPVEAD
jgi:hypothetical protein